MATTLLSNASSHFVSSIFPIFIYRFIRLVISDPVWSISCKLPRAVQHRIELWSTYSCPYPFPRHATRYTPLHAWRPLLDVNMNGLRLVGMVRSLTCILSHCHGDELCRMLSTKGNLLCACASNVLERLQIANDCRYFRQVTKSNDDDVIATTESQSELGELFSK